MKIKFIGAAREVTGSKHLITTNSGKTILLDCGMFQGKGMETDKMNRDFGFDVSKLDHIILSHAHIDHSGLIPYIYKQGFTGSVICTNATRDLCALMLVDSGFIHEQDIKWFNKKRAAHNLPPVQPIYNKKDAQESMQLFIGVAYDRKFRIDENISVKFTNSGHMLGSAVVTVSIKEDGKVTNIAYTGDIGRPSNRILKSPKPFPQADILLTESTYGDRLHEVNNESEDALLDVINDTCVRKGGKLIIPSFSVGRTQEIVFSLDKFFNQGRLPKIPIYVDSPLSMGVTGVFRLHSECFNDDILHEMMTDSDPFGFNSLHYVESVQESKALNVTKNPCVIISASGMMEAGRVKHHLANSISDPKNTILAVGYCAPMTLGARILSGEKEVSIFGTKYKIKADIKKLESYSGHGDYKEMAQYLACQDKNKLKKLILVHGEYETQLKYKVYLEEQGFKNILIPDRGEEITV
jgi:metallo-beta-lactamase family protein